MLTRWAVLFLFVVAAGSRSASQDAARPADPADIVLRNAKVLTVDDRFRIATALAIRGGRFIAVRI